VVRGYVTGTEHAEGQRSWWERITWLLTFVASSTLCALMAVLIVQVLGRLHHLLYVLAWPGVSLLIGAVGAWFGGRWAMGLLGKRLPWWLGTVALLVIPAACVAFSVGLIYLDLIVGRPVTDCRWPGVDPDDCEGRDWSLMQSRLGYHRMAGPMKPSVCRAFVEQVATGSESPLDSNERVHCPFERPRVWRSISCEEVGMFEAEECYACSGRAGTGDMYWHVQGFSNECSKAAVFYGKNVHPREVDKCRASLLSRPCHEAQHSRLHQQFLPD
jgi:hypothetical protein